MIKKIIIFLNILIFAGAFSQVKWLTLEQGLAAQELKPKKMLMNFCNNTSEACKSLENKTFANPAIADYINENFYAVKFDVDSKEEVKIFDKSFKKIPGQAFHSFAKFMNVTSLPSIIFVDEETMPITILNGNVTAKELDPYLRLIATGDYTKIDSRNSWDAAQSKMKSKLK